MVAVIRGQYDGKVIVPTGPVDLPRDTELLFRVEDPAKGCGPFGVSGQSLLRFAGMIGIDDLDEIKQAITEGCEQVRADEW